MPANTFSLAFGIPATMYPNAIYVLPPNKSSFVQSSLAIESSVNGDTSWAALTGANTTGVNSPNPYIRCTSPGCNVKITEAASGITPASDVTISSVALGTNPATAGPLRLPNNGTILARNATNTADLLIAMLNGSNQVAIGNFTTKTILNGHYQLNEIAAPAIPGVNAANIWCQDNGSGKTQLMIQFNTGVPIQLAIQV